MQTCPYCRSVVDGLNGQCENCRERLDIAASHEEIIVCECGVENRITDKYCKNCTNDLQEQIRRKKMKVSPETNRGFLMAENGETVAEITEEPKIVGRMELARYAKPEDTNSISRQHITLVKEAGKFYVEDKKNQIQDKPSANGTVVISKEQKETFITNKERCELSEGDKVKLANTVTLAFVLRERV